MQLKVRASVVLISALVCLPMHAQKNDLTLNTIVIDAGHGGKDVGCVSPDKKTYEKTIALKLAKLFAEQVEAAYPEVNVVMTRDRDEFVPLSDRARAASKAGAKLFISFHINATARSRTANGFSAYILGQASAKSKYDSYDVNLEVCKRENSVIYLEDDYSTKYGDFDSSPESQILLKLMQNAYREQSLSFAEKVCAEIGDSGPFTHNWGVMQGNFAVLREASMPAVLLEYGFMTNPKDLTQLRDPKSLQILADRTFAAFVKYKREYDASVQLGEDDAVEVIEHPGTVQQQSNKSTSNAQQVSKQPSTSKAEQVSEQQPSTSDNGLIEIVYGTQIMASSKNLKNGDPIFKGQQFIKVPSGSLYKYIVGVSSDRAEAVSNYRELKKLFPDSFFVKVVGGRETAIEKP